MKYLFNNKNFIGISGLIIFSVIFIGITRWNSKKVTLEIFKNGKYTKAIYIEKIVPAKGAVTAICSFRINNKEYLCKPTLASFPNSKPAIGNSYFVIYNSLNPNESICFLNLKVPDSLDYLKSQSLNKIPIANYQRKADSFMLSTFRGGLAKYFPPYYSKEDLKELEILFTKEND